MSRALCHLSTSGVTTNKHTIPTTSCYLQLIRPGYFWYFELCRISERRDPDLSGFLCTVVSISTRSHPTQARRTERRPERTSTVAYNLKDSIYKPRVDPR